MSRDDRVNFLLGLSLDLGVEDHVQEERGEGGAHGVGSSAIHGYGRVEEEVTGFSIRWRHVGQSVR